MERGRRELPTPAYDELDKAPPLTNGTSGGVVSSDIKADPPVKPPKPQPLTPRFDDTIYAMRQDIGLEGGDGGREREGEEETDGANGGECTHMYPCTTSSIDALVACNCQLIPFLRLLLENFTCPPPLTHTLQIL